MRTRFFVLLAAGLAGMTLAATAADWPQWRGPTRNGISQETGLLKEWPKDGPRLVWKTTDVLGGYSTPSVADGRIYTIGSKGQDEFTLALNVKDGKEVWKTRIGPVGKNIGPQYPGSRGTPTVDGENVYCIGSDGDLVCLSAAKGDLVWKKSLRKDFGGQPNNWAYSESPLVDGDLLICTPGGPSATLAALNKKTGEPVWKSPLKNIKGAGSASVIAAEVGGKKHYVAFVGEGLTESNQGGVVGVDAKTGEELWRYTKTSDKNANIMTPLFHDGAVFNAAVRVGTALLKLKADGAGVKAEEVYFSTALRFGTGGVVVVDGYLYGVSGGLLTCIDYATGKKKWDNRCVGAASIIYADGLLFVRGENGDVALVEASPESYKEKGRFKQPDHAAGGTNTAWQHPVLSDGKLYLRDQNVLLCYDVKGK